MISTLVSFLTALYYVYTILILLYIIMSWVQLPYNVWIGRVRTFLHDTVEPYLGLFRRMIPPIGGVRPVADRGADRAGAGLPDPREHPDQPRVAGLGARSSKPDGMSLSPAELRHQRPKRTFIGYRVSEVDEIMTHATSAFETVWRDRADLEDRVHELETSLGELRDTEHAMRDALVTAQRTADELRAAAGRDAELIVREAEARAREIIHKTYAEREQVRREVERLRADERQFRTRLRTLLGTTLQTVRDHEEMIAEPAGELTVAG